MARHSSLEQKKPALGRTEVSTEVENGFPISAGIWLLMTPVIHKFHGKLL